MLTMTPSLPAATIARAAARVTRNAPDRLVSSTCCQSVVFGIQRGFGQRHAGVVHDDVDACRSRRSQRPRIPRRARRARSRWRRRRPRGFRTRRRRAPTCASPQRRRALRARPATTRSAGRDHSMHRSRGRGARPVHCRRTASCRVPVASCARSRRTFFWILPVAVFGSGPNTTVFGTLKCAIRSRHHCDRCRPRVTLRVRLERDERARRLAPAARPDARPRPPPSPADGDRGTPPLRAS